ncbi:MAG: helix-turn-helix transcriptional regulator [Clostridia bacterium]|nr:helix-turn-helix transcriptional regulator [Clostridia bacterium]
MATYNEMLALRSELKEKISSEGLGAAAKWFSIAAAASAGNAAAREECARLLGHPVENMGDTWSISVAAGELMTPGELARVTMEATQALNVLHGAQHDADEYLANRLGALRRERGLTQQQLSRLSGVGLSTLQKLENGANRLLGARVEIALKLARALGVTVEDLLG